MLLERELTVAVPREALWPLVSDTDRLNREVGLPDVSYELTPAPAGGSEVRAKATTLGVRMEWQELPFDWSTPSFFSVERRFTAGPVRHFIGGFDLKAAGPGSTIVRVWAEIETAGFFTGFVARKGAQRGIDRMVEACRIFEAHLQKRSEWSHTRRLHRGAYEPAIARGCERLREAGFEAGLVDRLAAHLRIAPEEAVTGMRPYLLAERWGMDRRRVLEIFLEGARAGLVELRWTVVCPSCRGGKVDADHLHAVRRDAACTSCAITFTNEFDRTVEARFDVHPSVRSARKLRFCAGGPGNTPHRTLQVRVMGGKQRAVVAVFEPGLYHLRSPQSRTHAELRVEEGAPSEGIEVELGVAGVVASAARVGPGETTLVLINTLDGEALFQADRASRDGYLVSGAELSTLQRFRDLFAEEAIEPGQEMSIGRLAFLFSDLEGSTALYEQVGDVPAFALVRGHFAFMKERIAAHRGAVVKTMGDAVMAVFAEPADALRAAARIQRDAVDSLRQASGGLKLRIKVGVHAGPCVVVGENGIVDYFGSTVNLAQRVQAAGRSGDVVVSEAAFGEMEGAAVMGSGWEKSRETLEMRGFPEPVPVVRCRPAP